MTTPLFSTMLLGAGTVPRTPSSGAQWNSGDAGWASYTFTGSNVIASLAGKGIRTVQQFAGDFDVQCTYKSSGTGQQFFFYASSDDASFVSANGGTSYASLGALALWGGTVTSTTAIRYDFNNSAEQSGVVIADGDILRFTRTGSTCKVYINGVLSRTFTGTSSATVRLAVNSVGNAFEFDAVSWTGGA